jgi:hypothetical protein
VSSLTAKLSETEAELEAARHEQRTFGSSLAAKERDLTRQLGGLQDEVGRGGCAWGGGGGRGEGVERQGGRGGGGVYCCRQKVGWKLCQEHAGVQLLLLVGCGPVVQQPAGPLLAP